MEVALGAVVVALAVAFVMLPLLRARTSGGWTVPDLEDSATTSARRREIYRQMLELELDHRVGKLSDADYRELSESCLARAAALLAEEEDEAAATEERVEQEIRAMREALRSPAAASAPAGTELRPTRGG